MSARRLVASGLFVVALAVVALLAWLTSRSLTASPATPAAGAEPSAASKAELRAEPRVVVNRQLQASAAEPRVEPSRAPESSARVEAPRAPLPPGATSAPAPALTGQASAATRAPVAAEADETDTLRFEISKDGIRSAIDSVLPDLQACYEGWLQVGKPVRGKVRVSLRIEADHDDSRRGVITGAEVLDSELHHPLIEACLLNALSQPEFDPPADGGKVMVTYPLVFDDEDPEDS